MLRQTTRQCSQVGPSCSEGSRRWEKETAMAADCRARDGNLFESSRLPARLVKLEEQTYQHQHCIACGRDFAKRIDAAEMVSDARRNLSIQRPRRSYQ